MLRYTKTIQFFRFMFSDFQPFRLFHKLSKKDKHILEYFMY